MKADAVFAGGGMRGIGIVGALCYLEKQGYKWHRTAGTSSGAIIASLITAGYTAKEIKKMIVDINFLKFKDKKFMYRIPLIGKTLGIVKDKGIYSGDYLEKWMTTLLNAKGINKFKDVMSEQGSMLKIIASDITKKKCIIMPDDLIYYGIDPMEFEIAKAVRMSTSIPFYFKPIKLQFDGQVSYIVDGAITCNYPINIFDVDGIPRWPTIGFEYINSSTSYTANGRHDALAFLFDIAGTMSSRNNNLIKKEKNKLRTIFIPTKGVEVTDFNIPKEKSLELFKEGYKSAKKFLKTWNFKEYVYFTQSSSAMMNNKNNLDFISDLFFREEQKKL